MQVLIALAGPEARPGLPRPVRGRFHSMLRRAGRVVVGRHLKVRARTGDVTLSVQRPGADQVGAIASTPLTETLDGSTLRGKLSAGGFADRCPHSDGTVRGRFSLRGLIDFNGAKAGDRTSLLLDASGEGTYEGRVGANGRVIGYDLRVTFRVIHRTVALTPGHRFQTYGQTAGELEESVTLPGGQREIHSGTLKALGDDTDADAARWARSILNTIEAGAEQNFDEGSYLCNDFHVHIDSQIVDDYSGVPGQSGATVLHVLGDALNFQAYGTIGDPLVGSGTTTYAQASGTVTEQDNCGDQTAYTNSVTDGQGDILDAYITFAPPAGSYPGPVQVRLDLHNPTELWTRTGCGDSGSARDSQWKDAFLMFHPGGIQADGTVLLPLLTGSGDDDFAHATFESSGMGDVGEMASEQTTITVAHTPRTQSGDVPAA